jgi:hypothetical protein
MPLSRSSRMTRFSNSLVSHRLVVPFEDGKRFGRSSNSFATGPQTPDSSWVNVFVNRLLAFGATNEVAVHWRMRLGNHSNEGIAIVHVRRGKIVLLHEFLFNPLSIDGLRAQS